MSKTFISRPTVQFKKRGQGPRSDQTGVKVRGRGGQMNGRGGHQLPSAGNRSGLSSNSTTARAMNSRPRQYPDVERDQYAAHQPPDSQTGPTASASDTGTQGQNAGAYTVFQPNVRKRQQIHEMAQRETEQYERFKQERAPRSLNYAGTVGGGQMSQTEARNRQIQDSRFQKLKRQQRQEEQRFARREEEQRQIDAKLCDARRKAEQNEMRGKTANREELRRQREGFLRQVEKNSAQP